MMQKYKIVLMIFIALFAIQFLIVNYFLVNQNSTYASAINISGKQRMLSQRIALLAHRLLGASDEFSKKEMLDDLQASLSQFKTHHQALLSGDNKLGLPILSSAALQRIYFKLPYRLDHHVKWFIQLANAVLLHAKKGLLKDNTIELLQMSQLASSELVRALDVAVWQFQREADDQSSIQKWIVYGLLILMIATLFLNVGIYMFMNRMEVKNRSLMVSKFVFEHSSDGIITTDSKGVILTSNNPVRHLIGYASGSIIGRNIHSLIDEIALHGDMLDQMLDATAKTGEWRGELLQKGIDRKPLSIGFRSVYIQGEEVSTVSNYVMSMTDISEQKTSEDKYRFISLHDQLTGLLNRTALYHEFDSKAAIARREKTEICVLMMDLDGFKQVNDTLGHDAGDHVLVTVSERMNSALRSSDTLARLGGDEFIVLAPQSSDGESNPEKVAEKILQAVSKPVHWQGDDISVGISIGIAKYPEAAESLDLLIKKADMEMYRVKEGGRNSFSVHGNLQAV